jgi:hypothetical protein
MDGNAALIIIVGLIGVAIGFALGVAVTSMREPRQERRVVDSAQIERRIRVEAARPAPPAEAAPTPSPVPLSGTPLADLSTPPPSRPSLNTVDVLARALQPDLHVPEPPPRSITAQIDDILQEKLQDSPFASSLIRLVELPSKGVVVMVGKDQYEGVDAVPDEDIRQLIRSAVAEWERRVAE